MVIVTPGSQIKATHESPQLLSVTQVRGTCDGTGTTTYSWQDEDRMMGVDGPAGTISYTYDADNVRVSVGDGTITKNYLIDTRQQYAQIIAEYENTTSPTVEYVLGLERISQDRGGNVSIYLTDGQGSVRQLTSSSGNVTDQYSYFAFVEELSSSGSTENEFRYVGEQFDPNAGFYYNRARWYSPGVGRFTSVDPYVGDPQSPVSLHRYLYGNVSPVSMSDPTGNITLGEISMTVSIVGILNIVNGTLAQLQSSLYWTIGGGGDIELEWEGNIEEVALGAGVQVARFTADMIAFDYSKGRRYRRKIYFAMAGLSIGPSPIAITSSSITLVTVNRPYLPILFSGAAMIVSGEYAGPKMGLGGSKPSTETTGKGFSYVIAGFSEGTMNLGGVKGLDLGFDILTGASWSPVEKGE